MSLYLSSPIIDLQGSKTDGIVFDKSTSETQIKVMPDLRYKAICSNCNKSTENISSIRYRMIRDLNIFSKITWLIVGIRLLKCEHCGGVHIEKLSYLDNYSRITKRLEETVAKLCEFGTLKDVSEYFGLDWKTVKEIDKKYLKKEFEPPNYDNLKLIAVDEIAFKKGHTYITIVLDLETGRVVWTGKDNTKATLDKFYNELTIKQKSSIQAVAMDMWKAYESSTRENVPEAKIVYDKFHLIKGYNNVIDKVRNETIHTAAEEQKELIKGSKYLLLKKKKT